jgi:nucleoid-associated protein YgaU
MNKEAKIGFTIILVLLCVFVTVLARRMYNSYVEDRFVAAENTSEETANEPVNADQEKSSQLDQSNAAFASDAQSTAVAAVSDSDKVLQATAIDDNVSAAAAESMTTNHSADSIPDYAPPPSKISETSKTDADNIAITSYRDNPRNDNSADILGEADSTDYRKNVKNNYNRMLSKMTRKYTVNEDESLFDIARCELGKASRWVEIYNLNIDVLGKDMDFVTPSTLIILPDDDADRSGGQTRRSRIGSLR